MNKRFAIFAVALMLFFGAGCSSAPVVVHEISDPSGPVLKRAPESLLVLPLSGQSPRYGIALGIRTAAALRQAGYPAVHVTISDGISPVITGWIEDAAVSEEILWLDIDWVAYAADGSLLGKFKQKTAVPRAGWERLSHETLNAVVIEAVPGLNELVALEMFPPGTQMARSSLPIPGLAAPSVQNQDTIVISGEGIAKIGEGGFEIPEPLVTVTTEMQTGVSGGESQQAPIQLIDPSTRVKVQITSQEDYILQGLPDSYAEEIDIQLSASGDVGSLPSSDSNSDLDGMSGDDPDDGDASDQQAATLATVTPEVSTSETQTEMASQQASVSSVTTAFAPAMYRPVFLVRQAIGAPGNGNLELRDAMRKALRNSNAMVSDDPGQASHIVQGTVRTEVPFAGQQRVRIVWMVTNTAGLEMGTALQENDVPAGSLNQAWGRVAQDIANAAVLGIAQLFDSGLDAGSAGREISQPDLPHLQ